MVFAKYFKGKIYFVVTIWLFMPSYGQNALFGVSESEQTNIETEQKGLDHLNEKVYNNL